MYISSYFYWLNSYILYRLISEPYLLVDELNFS